MTLNHRNNGATLGLFMKAKAFFRNLKRINQIMRGHSFNPRWQPIEKPGHPSQLDGDLRAFFDSRTDGPGIWKWRHYFDIYERHFSRFRGMDVNILEIGIYSGGSLDMWRQYFGHKARIFGIDIEPACKKYENETTRVYIGDQGDRLFWKKFISDAPKIDIIIDDGGHTPEQQMVTLEELLPHLQPGGVYLCEDIHCGANSYNAFASFIHGMAHKLNEYNRMVVPGSPDGQIDCEASPFQAAIGGIHLYPYVTVIEKNAVPLTVLSAPKHGSEWQPF